MRIRKHAKLSSSSSSLPLLQNTTICQLNQSPWDIITFSPQEYSPPPTTPPPPPPPLHHHVEEEDSYYLVNGSLYNSNGALEREVKEYDNTPKWGDSNGIVVEVTGGGGYVDVNMVDPPLEKVENLVEEKEIFCSKIDCKGWQCHRIAKSGQSFCEHHLLSRLNKNNNGSNNNLARENCLVECDKKSIENRRRGRPKKASNDPSDYYYYSGFGPRWGGKRRGGQLSSTSSTNHTNSNSKYSSKDNVSRFETSSVEGDELLGSTRIEYGELDYMVEEDDEEEDGGSLKKRARKPVKARSLKSLM